MQYPPQPSTEVVLPEQVGASEQETARVPSIVVYANRIRAARSLGAMTNRVLLSALMLLPLAYVLLSILNHNTSLNPVQPYLLTLLAFIYVLMVIRLVILRLVAYRSLLVNPAPILLIQSKGVTIRGTASLRDTFLAWQEIEVLDIYRYKYHYLCIRPKDPRFLAARFTLLERALHFSSSLFGTPPLSLALIYLDKPVEEIVQQLYHIYAQELSQYQIQIRY
ncbi:MAG TPA: hypothetical protein VF458_13890 [Ktedonobacteraceae bacterium]